jgi:hypothetical protein
MLSGIPALLARFARGTPQVDPVVAPRELARICEGKTVVLLGLHARQHGRSRRFQQLPGICLDVAVGKHGTPRHQ